MEYKIILVIAVLVTIILLYAARGPKPFLEIKKTFDDVKEASDTSIKIYSDTANYAARTLCEAPDSNITNCTELARQLVQL